MNVIDENIVFSQRQRLTKLRIHYKQIGFEIGRRGMKDRNDVIPLLHGLHYATFFTRDQDYYRRSLRHSSYCLVYLDVLPDEVAEYIHLFLSHRTFRARNERMGKVVRLRRSGLRCWGLKSSLESTIKW